MHVLGPHGIASAESFSAQTATLLTRSRACAWIAGVLRARNSSVGSLSPLAPEPPSEVRWADFSSSDPFFADAVELVRLNHEASPCH